MTDRATIAAQRLASDAGLRASVVAGIADFFRIVTQPAPGVARGVNVGADPEHLEPAHDDRVGKTGEVCAISSPAVPDSAAVVVRLDKHALRNRDSGTLHLVACSTTQIVAVGHQVLSVARQK